MEAGREIWQIGPKEVHIKYDFLRIYHHQHHIFFIYGLDKLKAVNHWWRIPEWMLLGLAGAGGSVGAYLGMMVFRHKTLKPLFRFGVPVILIVHAIVAVYVWK